MNSPELDNLVRLGKLKREPPTVDEIAGLLLSADERLADAARPSTMTASTAWTSRSLRLSCVKLSHRCAAHSIWAATGRHAAGSSHGCRAE